MTENLTYEKSGVSQTRGDTASTSAQNLLISTLSKKVRRGAILSYDASFKNYKKPRLIVGSDGVGTKLKYAFAFNKHKNVGKDLVAMCVNDIARWGAEPIIFAVYRATGKINLKVLDEVTQGVVEACNEAGCSYISGETAEMPGFYEGGEYDLGGFAVGVYEEKKLIDGKDIRVGDVLVGLASSGLHSNGFSLVRRVFPPEKIKSDKKLIDMILTPTKIYVSTINALVKKFDIKAIRHITGGGLPGKLAPIIPAGLSAEIRKNSWEISEIFVLLQKEANISEKQMFNTFNMGIGMVVVVSAVDLTKVLESLNSLKEKAFVIGNIVSSKKKVTFV